MPKKNDKLGSKSDPEAAQQPGDLLVNAARAIGSALGTLAAKAKTMRSGKASANREARPSPKRKPGKSKGGRAKKPR